VRQAGGAIAVESTPGRGARFDVFLPRVEPPSIEARGLPATRPARGSETLLVAEDQERLRAVVARALREQGYVVLEAASPADAVRIAAEHDGRIDLLLADVIMPGMRGPELAHVVREKRPDVRVLFMSGFVDDAGLGDLAGAPGVGLIAKPFTPDALASQLRALLDADGRRA